MGLDNSLPSLFFKVLTPRADGFKVQVLGKFILTNISYVVSTPIPLLRGGEHSTILRGEFIFLARIYILEYM